MKDFLSMFEEISDILLNHYAGKDEKQNWVNHNHYASLIKKSIDDSLLADHLFYKIIDEMISEYKDGHIIWLYNNGPLSSCGFIVRRYNNELIITDVLETDTDVEIGWRIQEIDGISISEFANINLTRLRSESNERQKWTALVSEANRLTIRNNKDEIVDYFVKSYKFNRRIPVYSIEKKSDSVLYIRLDDFNNPDAIRNLLEANKSNIDTMPYWIIDVRKNGGGADSAYYPLLKYIFSKNEERKFDDMYFLMSEKNCDSRIALLQDFSKDWADKEPINKFIRELEEQRGLGFVCKTIEVSDEYSKFIDTTLNPKRIIVLSDVFCGSSGDQFVKEVKQASKIQVIGRATAGVIDYSNVTSVVIDENFKLMYPTSKIKSVTYGVFTNNGIQPDIHIPWTPEHLHTDIDIEFALKLIKDQTE